ncbi:MAG: hypothetical protein AAGF48_15395 [Pseudomonadota bacterium]
MALIPGQIEPFFQNLLKDGDNPSTTTSVGADLPVQSDPPDFANDDPRAQKPYQDTAGSASEAVKLERQQAYEAIYQNAVDTTPLDSGLTNANIQSGDFINLHTAQQAALINELGINGVVYFAANGQRIPTAQLGLVTPALTAVLSTEAADVDKSKRQVYILEFMQKPDFALLPLADQERLAGTASFNAYAESIGLTPNTTSSPIATNTVATARASALSLIDTAAQQKGIPTSVAAITLPVSNTFPLATDDMEPFSRQIEILRARVQNQGVFSEADIARELKLITDRFDRAEAFFEALYTVNGTTGARVPRDLENGSGNLNAGVIDPTGTTSTTGNALTQAPNLVAGYDVFIEQEKAIANLAQQRDLLAGSRSVELPSANGQTVRRRLDAPTLIMLFQQYQNLTAEARVAAETEEIRQQNLLLTSYNAMQQAVNETLEKFTNTGESAASETESMTVNAANRRVVAMFEANLGNRRHPIEILRGITTRPTFDVLNNAGAAQGFQKTRWESYGTQLSDSVSTINQGTQIKMNDINSLDRQKNRHFDLANNAVRKLADTLQNISRAI